MKNYKTMIKRLSIIFVLCLTLCFSLIFGADVQAAAYEAGTYEMKTNMKVHKSADKNSKVVAYIKAGKTIKVKTITNKKWAKVTVNSKTGYVSLKNAILKKAAKKDSSKGTTNDDIKQYAKGNYEATQELTVRVNYYKESKQIGTLPTGTVVKATTIKNKRWAKIKFNGKKAWVSLLYTKKTSKSGKKTFTTKTTDKKETEKSDTYTSGNYKAKSKLIVRKGAGTSYKKLGTLAKGTVVKVSTIKNKKWAKISYNGNTAYVSLKNTEKTSDEGKNTFKDEEESKETTTKTTTTTTTTTTVKTQVSATKTTAANADSIVKLAKSKLGCPYVSCGKGPNQFDCSGFVYYLYKQHGMTLSGTVAGLYNKTKRVARSDLKPGDMVFFAGTSKPGLCHVGLYVGDGMMIHAKGRKYGVVLDSIETSYRIQHYYGAGRVA